MSNVIDNFLKEISASILKLTKLKPITYEHSSVFYFGLYFVYTVVYQNFLAF